MLEPPADLTEEELAACLSADYGLQLLTLTFLPIGHDSTAWVYRADTTDGGSYFLKLRRTITNDAALLVPRHLIELGVASVVAPIPARSAELSSKAGKYALVLYPFISDRTGMSHGMSPAQWREYGRVVRSIHDAPISVELAGVMRRETFMPEGALTVRRLNADIRSTEFAAENQETVAALWRLHRSEILNVLSDAEDLGARLARTRPASVLCHADIHTNNVLIDPVGDIWIVDWDETVLAPRERDLMFVLGGGIQVGLVGEHNEALFGAGYGQVEVDHVALSFYRHAWAVSDIAAYGEQVFYRRELGAQSAHDAAERFQSLFRAGGIVDLALRENA